MTQRYEVGHADTDLEILTPDMDPDEHGLEFEADDEGSYALVIGDPWSSAFAIVGSPEELELFAERITDLVRDTVRNTALAALADLRGCMRDGYTPEQVNRVFGRIRDQAGVRLTCVWEYLDGYGFGGNSQFYVDGDEYLYAVDGDLWRWLNGDPHDPTTPASPGAPASWRGAQAEVPRCQADDGFHNRAIERRDAAR